MILADTNVVSEFMRATPSPHVLAWAALIEPDDLVICVVTVEEIERGLRRLPEGRRRRDLEQRWTRVVSSLRDVVAVYDVASARETADVLVEAEQAGRTMSLADAQIAGICRAGGYALATRNTRDFVHVDLTLVDPFLPMT